MIIIQKYIKKNTTSKLANSLTPFPLNYTMYITLLHF